MPTVLLARGSSTPDCSLNPMACVHAPYSSGQQHKEHRCCACPAKRLRSSLLSVCVCVCVCVCARSALGAVTCQRTHDFLAATPVDASSWRSPCATSRVKEARGAKRHIRRPRLGMRLLVSEIVRSAQSQTLRRCWARRGTRAHTSQHTHNIARTCLQLPTCIKDINVCNIHTCTPESPCRGW